MLPVTVKFGKGHHLLVDHADAVDERVTRAGDRQLAIVEPDLAAVCGDDPGEHLEQRGFASAVLAHQGMGFPAAHAERHTAQRPHCAERLVDVDELEAWHLVDLCLMRLRRAEPALLPARLEETDLASRPRMSGAGGGVQRKPQPRPIGQRETAIGFDGR